MKLHKLSCLLVLSIVLTSCTSTKKTTDHKLYDTVWELEYLSGPRIAFSGLYPNRKPVISFNKERSRVEGNNSCNGYSADFTLNGKQISFGEPGPTTMMFCGQGEAFFVNTMKKITAYTIDEDGKLNLFLDDVPMMRFKVKDNSTAVKIPEDTSLLNTGCYAFDDSKSSIEFDITSVKANKIKGVLSYNLYEKDANKGSFLGTLNGDKLIGKYTFSSEGIESVREVAFQVKGTSLVEGYGSVDATGTRFRDPNTISYTSAMPLTLGSCK
ncbi:META domain-containing protein [Zobellia amurskyensis]|uniref:META domain-containing protein n=1 Tax=Zobellia amurskyensis TaxID=248905 RepID=A0A7X2ZQB4_9FLAO|nr:META domain-containing protein [Zobellia amurskyensis]MUH34425.1 META domain-containing protein [Zobellia amurskyensis]